MSLPVRLGPAIPRGLAFTFVQLSYVVLTRLRWYWKLCHCYVGNCHGTKKSYFTQDLWRICSGCTTYYILLLSQEKKLATISCKRCLSGAGDSMESRFLWSRIRKSWLQNVSKFIYSEEVTKIWKRLDLVKLYVKSKSFFISALAPKWETFPEIGK